MAEEKTTVGIEFDLEQAKKDLKALNDQIKQLNSTTDDTEETVKALERQWDLLDTAIKAAEGGMKEFEVTSVKTGAAEKTLGQELKEITVQLQRMKLEGKEGTVEYQNLIERAGQLKDAMGDTAAAINKTASDTSNLDAVLGAASAVSGGFGLAVSTMSLLGADTDDVAKAQKKLMQAIALVNSVQSINNALNKDSALMVKLQALSYKLLGKEMQATAVATNAASGAMSKMKAALITTGIGALVVALGFAVSKLMDFIEKTKGATKEQLAFKKALQDNEKQLIKTFKDSDKALQGLYNSQEKVKKAIKDSEKAVKDFGKTSAQELKEAKGLVDKYAFSTETHKKSYEDAVQAARDANAEYKKLAEQYERSTKKGIKVSEGLMARLDELKEKRDEAIAAANEEEAAYTAAATKEQENLLKILELEKKISDERKARKREYDEQQRKNVEETNNLLASFVSDDPLKYYEQQQKNIDTIRDNALARENERYAKELENKELTDKEKERLEEIHNQNKYQIYLQYLKNLQAADDEYNAYLNELQAQHDANVLAARETLVKNSIDSTVQLRLEALEREYNAEIEIANKIGADTTAITAAYQAQQTQIQLEAMDERVAIAQSMTNNIASALDDLFEDNKEMQIATTVASTIADASRAFTTTLAQGGAYATPLAVTAAAAVVAKGAASIKKLKATNKKSQSVSGSESGTVQAASQLAINTGTSSVAQAIISRNAPVTAEATIQPVLVVDEVTYKQQQQNNVTKISTI